MKTPKPPVPPPKRYKVGDIIPVNGAYICVPCGYFCEFVAGERFPTCEVCLAGTPEGWKGWTEPEVEFWELSEAT